MAKIQEKYRLRHSLNAFVQLDLVRKLAPAISILEMVVSEKNKDKPKSPPMIMVLGQLPQDSYQYVLRTCLGLVDRKQDDGTYAKLTTQTGELMFDDTTVSDIMELIAWVIEENLGDFYRTALSELE